MSRTIDVVIYRQGRHWAAQTLQVEVSSFGDSPDDARASIQEALELYFEDEPGARGQGPGGQYLTVKTGGGERIRWSEPAR